MNNNYTQYQARIRKSFTAAYNFFEEHNHARTDEDWKKIAGEIALLTDSFTIDLIVAVVAELEREYKNNMKRTD